MKFEEFMKELERSVEDFKKNWKANSADNPEVYPMEMPRPDWWEQFVMSQDEDK